MIRDILIMLGDDWRNCSPGMVVESALCACFLVLWVALCVVWAVGAGG